MREASSGSLRPLVLVLGVVGLGLISILLLIGTDRLRRHGEMADRTLALTLADLQRDIATSHLWLEEYVSGDSVDDAEIFDPLVLSLARVDRWLGQSTGRAVDSQLRPFTDRRLLSLAGNLKFLLQRFAEIAAKRHRGFVQGEEVGVGSPLDVEYDRVFAELRSEAVALEQALEQRRQSDAARSNRTFIGIIIGWGLLLALAATGLWTRERHRQQTELALGDSQEQLLQAQKMEAVGRLADGIAHDINNYLAALRGQCELVAMRFGGDPRISSKMEDSIGTIHKASALIDRLLAFSRQRPIEPTVLNLNRLVEGLGKMMGRLLGDDVRLKMALNPGLWNVRADPAQLEQVIVNLLVNARDAMARGGDLEVVTENRPTASGDHVVLSITDSGAGIEPEIRDKIFEPFFTTKLSSGSSGLGLATVYGVVQRHGGRIEVDSEVGRGTIFEIFLPRTLQPLTAVDDSPVDAEPLQGAGESLLLVDDNSSFRHATAALLEGLGYRVEAVADGEQALLAIDRLAGLRLVLTDVVMPGLDGTELLRQLDPRSGVRLIFISGHSASELERRGFSVAQGQLLKKPFSAVALARMVHQALQGP